MALDATVMVYGRPVKVGVSIGIVAVRLGEVSPSEAMRRADAAMYVAKRSGKRRIVFYSEELDQEHVAACRGWVARGMSDRLVEGEQAEGQCSNRPNTAASPMQGLASRLVGLLHCDGHA